MRLQRRTFLVRSARGALGLSLLPPAAQGALWRAPVADLEKHIGGQMAELAVPGVSAALIKDGKLVWRRGFGVKDAASKQRVGNDTVFAAGSMSKPVFAYAVLKLVEKGVLNLDTPLTRYTSERFLPGDPRLDLITARHVLSHTSGFPNWRSEAEPLKIRFTPGERFLYSGEGYNYLQSIVTQLTGRVDRNACGTYEAGLQVCATDIAAYLKANVLAPFGMTSSGYVWDETLGRHLATPHDQKGAPLAKGKSTAIDAARYAAAGTLLTTPTDYAKFIIEVINPGKADAYRLGKGTRDMMVRPHVKTNDEFKSSWALGWQVQESGVINHGGDNTGFHAHALALPENKSGFVIMTNGENGGELITKLLMGDLIPRLL